MIRQATRDDFEAAFELICALADYENLPRPDVGARSRLLEHGWPTDGSQPHFEMLLAEEEADGAQKRSVGYAILLQTYSSFLARPTLYIEDIFVLPESRSKGYGRGLMEAIKCMATERSCGRIEWVVLDWNTSAQEFYQRQGAHHLKEWQYYRLPLT